MTTEERATVRVKRRFDALAMRVYEAWVEPRKVQQWILALTSGDEVVRLAMTPRVGQTFALVVRRGSEELSHSGEYIEVVRPQRLVFTWVEPVVSKETTLVRIDLTPVPSTFGGTNLLLTHERILPDETGPTETRWNGALDSIAAMVRP